jgi:hypothetical protein
MEVPIGLSRERSVLEGQNQMVFESDKQGCGNHIVPISTGKPMK